MRPLPFLLAICAGIVCIGTHAEAQNYPWCASYSAGDTGGGMNCGFTTFQQCLDNCAWDGQLLRVEYAIPASTGSTSIQQDSKTLSILTGRWLTFDYAFPSSFGSFTILAAVSPRLVAKRG